MKTLVVTDVQRDFFHPEGSLYVKGGELLPFRILDVAGRYDRIVFTLDWHPGDHCSFREQGGPWPVHCVAYTVGAGLPDEFAPLLAKGPDYVRFFKKGMDRNREEYGAFNGLSRTPEHTVILDWFRCSDEIHVCGIAGDYCVKETAAKLLNYIPPTKLKILTDCICSIDDGSALNDFIIDNNLK